MAKVYKYVPGVPATPISRTLPNGDKKTTLANKLERVVALHADVQRKLEEEGMKIAERVDFRLEAVQARELMFLRELLDKAQKSGDPAYIAWANAQMKDYEDNKTFTFTSHGDVDFHIGFYRADGQAFVIEDQSLGILGAEVR